MFPSEQIIRNSALFKASPFHALSDDQKAAEESILSVIIDLLYARRHASNAKGEEPTRLIVVQGAAGTGKTVLLSHLFYRIETELGLDGIPDDENDGDGLENSVGQISTMGQKSARTTDRRDAYILVNHHEQANVYNQIVTKLGLQKKRNDVVLVPSAFINKFSEPMIGKDSKLTHRGTQIGPKVRRTSCLSMRVIYCSLKGTRVTRVRISFTIFCADQELSYSYSTQNRHCRRPSSGTRQRWINSLLETMPLPAGLHMLPTLHSSDPLICAVIITKLSIFVYHSNSVSLQTSLL